ncbi:PREDICTED: uncharacterized protein LOC109230075 [Nicotiana attenuata]|uniref:uncharacterized protein LOC109230075 n=1 Tax=Nicotiana attenuata TaxID=49451 RepID=UPI000904F376|nr:PREDICTED: uncharacterized protein LOC109230075 [Nicotiana attenuata]
MRENGPSRRGSINKPRVLKNKPIEVHKCGKTDHHISKTSLKWELNGRRKELNERKGRRTVSTKKNKDQQRAMVACWGENIRRGLRKWKMEFGTSTYRQLAESDAGRNLRRIEEALRKGELETGKGLNQELGLARAGDTRWGSHYKSFNNFILMFGPIIDVLDAIAVNARFEEKCKAKGYLKACLTFEIVFMLYLMRTILAITNELSAAFQKKEQDIVNAMLLVGVAKDQLQELRKKGWDSLINEVSKFCMKYDISIPEFDELYVIPGRSRRRVAEYTVSHHYRVKVFYRIIDWQFQELNSRFDEVTTDLLLGVACLNPADSFSNFDIEKILRLAELYPDDFDKYSMVDLRFQLQNYIVDVRDHDKRFSDLRGLGNLSTKLVETKKHGTYPLIFQLVKFALLLPVATATVERAFSAMKLIKTDLRSRMDDEFLSSCLVPYIEKDVFSLIPNEAIMNTFQNMKTRRGEL